MQSRLLLSGMTPAILSHRSGTLAGKVFRACSRRVCSSADHVVGGAGGDCEYNQIQIQPHINTSGGGGGWGILAIQSRSDTITFRYIPIKLEYSNKDENINL